MPVVCVEDAPVLPGGIFDAITRMRLFDRPGLEMRISTHYNYLISIIHFHFFIPFPICIILTVVDFVVYRAFGNTGMSY